MDFLDPEAFTTLLMTIIFMIPVLLMSKVIPVIGTILTMIIMGIVFTIYDSSFMIPMLFIVAGSALILWKGQ